MTNRVRIDAKDGILKRFENQLGFLGEGKARVAMARALNHTGRKAYTAVRQALRVQTSAPAAIIRQEVVFRGAAHKGSTALEAIIRGRGSELPLGIFKPQQTEVGASAFVWGKRQVYVGTFGAPGDNAKLVARLGGQPFHREGAARYPIQRVFGPSLPKEMLKDETRATFERISESDLQDRIAHEIARMLPG